MTILRAALGFIGALFAALILWAAFVGDFWSAGAWLFSNPWGIVTFADLYFGFLLAAVIIGCFERTVTSAACWIIPIPFLGNIWVVVWLIFRLPELRRRLTQNI